MAPVAKAPVVKKATFQDNVKAALKGGKASAQAVLKFVAAERNVPVEKCRFLVKVTLKKMVDAKLVTQLKGTGATGSFKLTKAALAPPKAKKPVKKTLKKKTVAKKVAKKVTKTLKKVTIKKAPKPSGAAKKPAAKKAPAKKAVAAKKAAPKAAAKAKAPAKKTIKAAAKAYRAPATSAKKAKK